MVTVVFRMNDGSKPISGNFYGSPGDHLSPDVPSKVHARAYVENFFEREIISSENAEVLIKAIEESVLPETSDIPLPVYEDCGQVVTVRTPGGGFSRRCYVR